MKFCRTIQTFYFSCVGFLNDVQPWFNFTLVNAISRCLVLLFKREFKLNKWIGDGEFLGMTIFNTSTYQKFRRLFFSPSEYH
jgi:hypothetical protein